MTSPMLAVTTQERDLGIIVDCSLKTRAPCSAAVKKIKQKVRIKKGTEKKQEML